MPVACGRVMFAVRWRRHGDRGRHPPQYGAHVSPDRIYQYTSIARPVDPSYPTNRAVLILSPLAAAASAALHWLGIGQPISTGSAAVAGALIVFASWALARELAPDDNPGAFVSVALAFAAHVLLGATSVLLLFLTLFLVRIVNRSTGLAARPWDTIGVVAFAAWATFSLEQPLLGAVGAVAFVFDAVLAAGRRYQLIAAAACAAASVYAGVRIGFAGVDVSLQPGVAIAVPAIFFCYLILVAMTRRVESKGDTSEERLSVSRVRAGMLVGGLVAAQAVLQPIDHANGGDPLLWATLLGVTLGGFARTIRTR